MISCDSFEEAKQLYESAIQTSNNNPSTDELIEAANKLKISADFGFEEAQYVFALWLMFGKGVEKNVVESFKYFKLSADNSLLENKNDAQKKPNINSIYNVGICYLEGKGVSINPEAAFQYFSLGSQLNHPPSQLRLAEQYRDGIGTESNDRKAASLFKAAADSGNLPIAQLEYGKCLRDGFGVKKNEKEARKYFALSANQRNHDAEFNLGVGYLNEGDIDNAIKYFEKSAIDGNNHQAQLSLSKIYDDGIGVEKNLEMAYKYIKMAADSNSPDAEYFLAFCLKQGKYNEIIKKEIQNDKNEDNNINNDTDHNNTNEVNNNSHNDDNNEKNENNANNANNENNEEDENSVLNYSIQLSEKYYKMSADNGFVHGQLIYAEICKEKKDIESAIKYYKMAADQNNSVAKFKLGVLLLDNGKEPQGAALLRSGADDHIGEAQLAFAKYLLKKITKKEDEEQFIHYLKMAADNKCKEAVELYIQCLQNGFCVEKNPREANRYQEFLENY